MWLLQEGERVSADRLFRVRSKQPFSSDTLKPINHGFQSPEGIEKPFIADTVQIGQLCVFMEAKDWRLGKISKYKERTKQAQKYKGCVAEVSANCIGVLCSWYSPVKKVSMILQLSHLNGEASIYSYIPLSLYLCTLPVGCLIISPQLLCKKS